MRAISRAARMKRFVARVRITGLHDCWEWTGGKDRDYGIVIVAGRRTSAHRFAYQMWVGPVVEGLVIDHLCRNRACVNPTHLEQVSNGENVLRGVGITARNATKTRCINGHAFDSANTYVSSKGRSCRACNLKARHRYLARKAER